MMNLELGANQIVALDSRIREFRDKIYLAKINNESNAEEFKKWYIGELNFIYKKVLRLIETIEKGALPETRQVISNLEN